MSKIRLRGDFVPACVFGFLLLTIYAPILRSQSQDDSQSRPPVSKSDVDIIKRARQILDSPHKWNRADNRICPQAETTFSLYCALETATLDVTGSFAHRGAAMQEARFVIDDDLAPQNTYDHRLMDYNNDSRTTFADVRRFFDLLQGRIEGRLEDQEADSDPKGAISASAKVTPMDIEIMKRVETLLDSPAKWDKASSQDCKPDAKALGLYCAFQAASISLAGKFDDEAPGIMEVRRLISKTAPHAAQYSARLVDYNNDPTVSFADLRTLLKTADSNLQEQMSSKNEAPLGR